MNIDTRGTIIVEMIERPQTFFHRHWWRGGSYHLTVENVFTWPGSLPTGVAKWVQENTKAEIYDTLRSDLFGIHFRSTDEAVAFKLRWL